MIPVEKKYKWIKIAGNSKEFIFADNNIAAIEVDGHKVCIAQTVSGLKACASKCPHAGGDMSQGKLDKKGNIICPVHQYIFNLSNGRDTNYEGYFLKVYPIKEREEGIFIGIEEGVLRG